MIKSFTCPCCGYPELVCNPYADLPPPPWSDHGSPPYCRKYGLPSYDVCDCCGFEFGNDDDPGTAAPVTFMQYLSEWHAAGCNWFKTSDKPETWILEEQLARAGISISR